MEDRLDAVEEGAQNRIAVLKEFYDSFTSELERAKTSMRNLKKEEEATELQCDKCGSPMVIKWGRNGKFIACSNYPACKNTANIARNDKGVVERKEPEVTDIPCEKCGKNMVVKEGRFGKFLGCSGYPECSHTRPIDTGVKCPAEGCKGFLCERKSRRGRVFFGCSTYPDCTFASWDRPLPEACPQCGHPFLISKYSKARGNYKACPRKDCDYRLDQSSDND